MSAQPTREDYLAAVQSAKERASQLPPAQLRDLLDETPIQAIIADLPAPVALIREPHGDSGSILVVAQAFRPWFRWLSGAGNMFVQGFVLHPDGRITEPAEKDLWDYT
jgi:hypothetical protein